MTIFITSQTPGTALWRDNLTDGRKFAPHSQRLQESMQVRAALTAPLNRTPTLVAPMGLCGSGEWMWHMSALPQCAPCTWGCWGSGVALHGKVGAHCPGGAHGRRKSVIYRSWDPFASAKGSQAQQLFSEGGRARRMQYWACQTTMPSHGLWQEPMA